MARGPLLVLALGAAVALCGPAALPLDARADAPSDPLAALQREGLSGGGAFAIVRSLCDEIGPRLAGSPADRAAVSWAVAEMQRLGLAKAHAEPVKVRHWERGEARASLVAPTTQPLALAALGGSVGTPAQGLEADVVEAANLAELKKLDPATVRGKIVFLDPIMRRARDGSGYGEAVPNRGDGAKEAAALGAVGLLLRSIGTDHERLPHTGAKHKDEHEIPAAALAVPDAELLHRVLEDKKRARVRLFLGSRTLPDAESANVVGEVTGRDRPGEIVLLGAHLDSWDLGTGAIDDGAGVAIVLEAARLLLRRPPRRTVRVVLYANEEHGIDGAKGYASAHRDEAGAHVAAMEADFGADAVYQVSWRGDPRQTEGFARVARALAPLGVARDDRRGFPGADVGEMMALGVPVLELQQDGTRYFDWHHTANDTLDKIDAPTLESVAVDFATAAWTVAEMDGTLGRVPEADRKGH